MAKKKNYYFTQETEDAIIRYNKEDNPRIRNQIYSKDIDYPFDKLAENIIHTFKFYYFDGGARETQHEVITFLLEKMNKFTPGKGKAFSYFSIVAKNYLIQNNNKNYKDLKNKAPISVIDYQRNISAEISLEDRRSGLEIFMDNFVRRYDKIVEERFKSIRDKRIAYAILKLFEDRKNIEIFNKKALYILIREMTNTKTQHITKVVNVIKDDFANMYKKFESGKLF